jgi:hypothetical protein
MSAGAAGREDEHYRDQPAAHQLVRRSRDEEVWPDWIQFSHGWIQSGDLLLRFVRSARVLGSDLHLGKDPESTEEV